MTAPADLEAVKAMLVDALDRTYMHGPGDVFLIDGDELWIDGNRSMDADKLATTVAEWFAKNQTT